MLALSKHSLKRLLRPMPDGGRRLEASVFRDKCTSGQDITRCSLQQPRPLARCPTKPGRALPRRRQRPRRPDESESGAAGNTHRGEHPPSRHNLPHRPTGAYSVLGSQCDFEHGLASQEGESRATPSLPVPPAPAAPSRSGMPEAPDAGSAEPPLGPRSLRSTYARCALC